MKNIIWQKPDGSFAITGIADPAADSTTHAAYLKSIGAIPLDWVISAIDTATPPKSAAELERAASEQAKAKLAKLRADIFTDVLIMLAALPAAPKSIKDAAILAAAEQAKVKV